MLTDPLRRLKGYTAETNVPFQLPSHCSAENFQSRAHLSMFLAGRFNHFRFAAYFPHTLEPAVLGWTVLVTRL